MDASDSGSRKAAILVAAWQVFSTYGFRKTSMDDIAREAGMSRPALYRHFRNKEDIYRSLVQRHYDLVSSQVADCLEGSEAVSDRLTREFEAQGGEFIKSMLSSPHGAELLDAGKAMAGDIVSEGEAGLRQIYTDWLVQAESEGRIAIPESAESVALAISAGLKGLMLLGPDFETYRRSRTVLARLFADGLNVR